MNDLNEIKGDTYKERLLIDYLRSPESIRSSCYKIFSCAEQGQLKHFNYNSDALPVVADYVIKIIKSSYPNLDIPYHSRWRHFEVAGVDRLKLLMQKKEGVELVKSAIELVIISILLDAGAGSAWQYMDYVSNATLSKSEGLAAASFNLFMHGVFSSDAKNPYQVDAEGLLNLTEQVLSDGLQVSPQNNLVGLNGRLKLLQQLGANLKEKNEYFKCDNDVLRLGDILDYWLDKTKDDNLSIHTIFSSLLDVLSDIWPKRYVLDGVNLGDVWPESLNITNFNPRGFIPFHKLTQWLCYSLIEPLALIGITVTEVDLLTGLPEYRNGGLLVDFAVLTPKIKTDFDIIHSLDSEFIIEWRAMTIALLDKLAEIIREKLSLTVEQLSLIKILQGGTWEAGRAIALQLRPGGEPPFKFDSDGTLF